MAGPSVRFRRKSKELVFENGPVVDLSADPFSSRFELPIQEIEGASLAALQSALVAGWGEHVRPDLADFGDMDLVSIIVTPSAEAGEWAEPSVTIDLLHSGRFRIQVLVAYANSPSDLQEDLEHLIRGYCDQHRVELLSVWSFENDEVDYYYASVSIPGRGKLVADAYKAAADIYALSQAFLQHQWSLSMVRSILQAGRPDLLLGQYESAWLECKSRAHDLSNSQEKIQLGQDVARFANSDSEALLIAGLRTKKDANVDGDRIVRVVPHSDTLVAARYHKALDRLIYPPIAGLEVNVSPDQPGGRGSLLSIFVPAQPEELKPFLVTGSIVGGVVEGAFISIVRRRGEHSIPVTPEAIHAALSAGRALLRRGRLPRNRS